MQAIDSWREVQQLVRLLQLEQDGLVDRTVERARAEIGYYAAMDDDTIVTITTASVDTALAALFDMRPPSSVEVRRCTSRIERGVRAGIPAESVLHRLRLTGRVLWDAFEQLAEVMEIDGRTRREAFQVLWDWTDAVSIHAALEHRRVVLELEDHDHERAAFVRELLSGTLSLDDVRTRAAGVGVVADAKYLALRARPSPAVPRHRLLQAIVLSAEIPGQPALITTVDGELVGLVGRRPELGDLDAIVGIGPAGDVTALPSSYLIASRALDLAIRCGRSGVHDLDDLAVAALVTAEDYVADALVARYLEPLTGLGEFGKAIEETLEAFFESGMRMDEAARAVFVHPNTLRHRLKRFEEATGAVLDRTEDAFLVWLSLQRRQLMRSE